MRFLRTLTYITASLAFLSSCIELGNRNPSYQLKNIGKRSEVKLLTFNILANIDFKARSDGYLPWNARKDGVLALIEQSAADFVVLEESSFGQAEDLRGGLSARFHLVINEGFTPDVAILVKKERFEIIEQGHWALEKPYLLHRIRRIALWVSVRDLQTGREIMVVGAHLDATGLKGDELTLIKAKLADQERQHAPIFFAGDFNINPDAREYSRLLAGAWHDGFAGSGLAEGAGNTFPFEKPTRRIDHILYFGEGIAVSAWQVLPHTTSPVISDHKAVVGSFIIDAAP
jgi:endonuclease/exonuclease/phosphatase family metal-dependent hydrolase